MTTKEPAPRKRRAPVKVPVRQVPAPRPKGHRRLGDVSVSITLPRELHQKAMEAARAQERTLVGLVRVLLREHLEGREEASGGQG